MKLEGSNVLITGGAGFIGSEVAKVLLHEYKEVNIRILDDFTFGSLRNLETIRNRENVEVIKGDVRDRQLVPKVLDNINIVYHLAARPFIPQSYVDPAEVFDVNATGTLNLLNNVMASEVNCFVHISTSEVYGTAQYVPVDEVHPTNPQSTYAASKLAAERVAFTMHKEHSFPLVIIRPFNTYGPQDSHPRIIPEIISQLKKGKQLRLGNTRSTRDFTYVTDIARGICAAATRYEAVGEVINLGSGQETSVEKLIYLISRLLGIRHCRVITESSRLRPFDVQRLSANTEKACRLLGWKPGIPLEEGLKRTIEGYVANGAIWNWEREEYRSVVRSLYGESRKG